MTAEPLVVTNARLVPVRGIPAPAEPVDLRIRDGRVVALAPRLPVEVGERTWDADGRWLLPGLWDAHVHPVMWGLARARIDLAGTADPDAVCRRVADHLQSHPGAGIVLGYGFRSAVWPRQPTVAELDAVTGARPVALASGDGHNGWLNSAALALIGAPSREGALVEDEWYAAYRLLEVAAADVEDGEASLDAALADAATRGVVGIVDFEFGSAFRMWPDRLGRGTPPVRVRAATYADGLGEVAALGLRDGDLLVPHCDRVTMGPVKVISDGSLNTMTAWCCAPFVGAEHADHPCGKPNYDTDDLVPILRRARELGLRAAVHAIGDRAFGATLAAFAETGIPGTIEHAQLIDAGGVPEMARLGLTASVQPVHLLDDREATARFWGDRSERVYAFRTLLDAGIPLALGSDAPVAPLDPWAAIAAAVHRSDDLGGPWHAEQRLSLAEALAASTDGAGTLGVGSLADIAILEDDPFAAVAGEDDPVAAARRLRGIRTAATLVGGEFSHGG
ncbi:amidohydrolase [Nostocoides jenkinsii]|uniref:Amidohydrolase 3 n=1 Tax=Nostocoides jenkinsii Ben 74 TaxID=1193518 RepID=A0A077M701_9MICO|nr:amidohydrolase family protein [Tetrasphaera jenkinsii]CCI52339.1 Amidohydrolase 3 [Tetrasphaera jenkinsii Ben 74]